MKFLFYIMLFVVSLILLFIQISSFTTSPVVAIILTVLVVFGIVIFDDYISN